MKWIILQIKIALNHIFSFLYSLSSFNVGDTKSSAEITIK